MVDPKPSWALPPRFRPKGSGAASSWKPRREPSIEDRKRVHASIVATCEREGNKAWVRSVEGARLIILHCRPESRLPEMLVEKGYRPVAVPGEFIETRPDAIEEVIPIGKGKTRSVWHPGPVRVLRFQFEID